MKKRAVLTMILLFISSQFYGQEGFTLENQIFKSEILSKDVKYNIYLPSEYEQLNDLPVLYYLHGFGGNHFSSSNFTSVIDSLINNHNFPKLIIISPRTDKTWYMDNADGTVMYSSMFINEFIPFIKKKYAVTNNPKKIIIAGNSMGGFGAMRFAMLYPDIFGICIGFQSAIDTDYQFKSMNESDYKKFHQHIYGNKESKADYIDDFFYENQPIYIAQKLSTETLNKVKWYIQCCDNDYHSGPNAQLHIEFRNKKVKHEYRVSDGKHSKQCVVGSYGEALGFLKNNLSLIYYNINLNNQVKKGIKDNDSFFSGKYKTLIEEAEKALEFQVNPVTNKTKIPASKNKHDYLSYAPYKWADSSKLNGLPWITKDGQINPVSQGYDTDFKRAQKFFKTIETLSWAYYYSDDNKYAEKAIQLIKIWYINEETKVNPNINFGQAVPGTADGRKAGVQEWLQQYHVITALQIFEYANILPEDVKTEMKHWFQQYLNWLLKDKMAIEAGKTGQNHANHYNHQIVGLLIYLGREEEAKQIIENAKYDRIAVQILPDGRQPKEMGRTRSVHYASLNLWSLTELSFIGKNLGVDLWNFETEDIRSLQKAISYLKKYINQPEKWPFKEISKGGVSHTMDTEMKPMLSKASTLLKVRLNNDNSKWYQNLTALEVLQYPPLELIEK